MNISDIMHDMSNNYPELFSIPFHTPAGTVLASGHWPIADSQNAPSCFHRAVNLSNSRCKQTVEILVMLMLMGFKIYAAPHVTWVLFVASLCVIGGYSLWQTVGLVSTRQSVDSFRRLLRASQRAGDIICDDKKFAVITDQVYNDGQRGELMRAAGGGLLPLPKVLPSLGGSGLASDDARRLYAVYGSQNGWASYVSEEFFHLFRLLERSYGWKILQGTGRPETWEELGKRAIAELGSQPDVILFMEAYDAIFLTGNRSAMPKTSMWLFMDDLHWFGATQRASKVRGILAADLVLGTYAYELDDFFPEAAGIARAWIPHAASSIYQLPLRDDVAYDVLLSGATEPSAYPYRALVESKINAGDTRFVQHKHPGYTNSAGVGPAFARILNSHLACITDGLRFNYTVGKMFEIPAAGCLLLVNSEVTDHLASLGFIAGMHYLPFTADSLDEIVDAVLDDRNRAKIHTIRAQGQGLIWSRHSVSHRAALVHELAHKEHQIARVDRAR